METRPIRFLPARERLAALNLKFQDGWQATLEQVAERKEAGLTGMPEPGSGPSGMAGCLCSVCLEPVDGELNVFALRTEPEEGLWHRTRSMPLMPVLTGWLFILFRV